MVEEIIQMNLTVLEGLYYIVTIFVSVGFANGFIKTLTISNQIEITLISNVQKFILKLRYFILSLLAFITVCIATEYIINSLEYGLYLIDFISYNTLLFFCDLVYLSLFKNKDFIQKYTNLVNNAKEIRFIFIFSLSYILTFITYSLREIIDYKTISFFQILFILNFNMFCSLKRTLKINGKNLKMDFGYTALFSPLFMKTMLLHNDNTIFNIRELELSINKLELSSITKYVIDFHSSFIYIFMLCVTWAIFIVRMKFNLPSFLLYKNRIFKITYITVDKYAICTFNEYSFMIKTDIIKDNYYCEYDKGSYYFMEKKELQDINIIRP